MKKHEIIFSTIKLPLDFILVVGAFFLAREIRLVTDLIPSIHLPIQTVSTPSLVYYSLAGASLYILLFITHGLYNSKITNSKIKESLDIIQYGFYWFLFFSVGVFFLKGILINEGNDIPRLIILFTFIISSLFILLERIILNTIQYSLLEKGYIERKNLILINNKPKSEILDIIKDIKISRIYNLLGYINTNKKGLKSKSIPYLGDIKHFKKLGEENTIDELLYIDSDYNKDELFELWEISKIFGIRYRYITNSFDITQSNTSLSLINKVPVLEIENTPLGIWGRTLKRILDIGGALIGLIFFLPLTVIVSVLIKIDDPSAPIIYKNRRIGQDGKEFNLYKFRYLKRKYCIKESYGISSDKDTALKFEKDLIQKKSTRKGPLYKIKNDPRKTKIGGFIEKYSIDEIPQLINVLIGNMSLVGPRPHQPREVQQYELWAKRLLTIKPGITGMAQVNGREENGFEEEAKMDIFYIENWNVLLDLKIILKTFGIILHRK